MTPVNVSQEMMNPGMIMICLFVYSAPKIQKARIPSPFSWEETLKWCRDKGFTGRFLSIDLWFSRTDTISFSTHGAATTSDCNHLENVPAAYWRRTQVVRSIGWIDSVSSVVEREHD